MGLRTCTYGFGEKRQRGQMQANDCENNYALKYMLEKGKSCAIYRYKDLNSCCPQRQ